MSFNKTPHSHNRAKMLPLLSDVNMGSLSCREGSMDTSLQRAQRLWEHGHIPLRDPKLSASGRDRQKGQYLGALKSMEVRW